MVSASVDRRERPRQPRRIRGKGWALVLAVAVQVGFLAVLIFSVQWQRRAPEAVSVELYAPPVKAPAPEPVQPPPPPKVEPPPPQPKAEPTPPPPKPPEPVAEKPDTRAADIALKAKQEQERKRKEEQERLAREDLAKAKLAEEKRKQDDKLKAEAKQKAETKERERRQQQEVAAMQAQLDREKALREQAAKEQAQRQQQQQQQAAAMSKGLDDWTSRIRSKIKGNVIVPPDIAGNPEAIFDVVQLPTGEIIEATLRKSSGNRAYDEAVQRAILKSSPLPRPERAELFQRVLNLRFRPLD